jgi:phosphoribosylformylglycinamidine synthase
VALRVERASAPFASRCRPGQRLVIPVKHGEGCYFADPDTLEALEARGQILLRYEPGSNPNGSTADIAGIVSAQGNVMGLMPHPEHAVDALLGSTDGAYLLGSLVDTIAVSVAEQATSAA